MFHFKPNKLFWGLLGNNAGSDNTNLINQDRFLFKGGSAEGEENTKNKQLSLDVVTFPRVSERKHAGVHLSLKVYVRVKNRKKTLDRSTRSFHRFSPQIYS